MSSYAIVAVGGQGTRLEDTGRGAVRSKSFILICGRPALYWTLRELRRASVSDVTLCGESSEILTSGEMVAKSAGFLPQEIHSFLDQGLGVHGIPGQLQSLPESFFFVAGHATVRASHYEMLRRHASGKMAYSVFPIAKAGDIASRTLISLTDLKAPCWSGAFLLNADVKPAAHVLSFPYLLNHRYVPILESNSWSIARSVQDARWKEESVCVFSRDLPEFDVASDFAKYRDWLQAYRAGEIIYQSVRATG